MKSRISVQGFTLLEVMISIIILAFVSLFSTQSIQRSISFKKKMQTEVDYQSEVRNALQFIERDINMAFHYRNLDTEMKQSLLKDQQTQSQQPQQPQQPGNTTSTAAPTIYSFQNETPPPNPTVFMGEDAKIRLTTLSNMRIFQNHPESSQLHLMYFVKDCREPGTSNNTTCLIRKSTPYLDQNPEQEGSETIVITHVKEFALRYLGRGTDDWVKQWRTDETGTDQTKNIFPDAVEITITTEWNKKVYTQATIANLRFPNNPQKNTATTK